MKDVTTEKTEPQISRRFTRIPRDEDIITTKHILERCNIFFPHEIQWVEDMIQDAIGSRGKTTDYMFLFFEETVPLPDHNFGKKLAGFAIYGPTENKEAWDLYWIAVDPSYQGKGLGKNMIDMIEASSMGAGCKHMYIETANFNTAANALYEKTGYKQMGLIEHIYGEDKHKHIWGKRL